MSEELRSKITILSETLESNLRAAFGDVFRTTAKGNNVDLFLEVQKVKKEQEHK